jgi:hypothetical protein
MMNPITSALRFTPAYSNPSPLQGVSLRQAPGVVAPQSTQVNLGLDTRVADAETYSARGTLGSPQARYLWQQENTDKLSMHMLGSIKGSTIGARFQGLGAALMEQLVANGGQRVSQSALLVGENSQPDALMLGLHQSRLREFASNSVTLNLTTASGATVTLGLYSGEQGMAVDAQVQNGTLDAAQLKGLADLADGFQAVINGLNQDTPRLQLDGLLKLDQSLFSGMQMTAKLDQISGGQQTFDLRLDETTRAVSLQGPNGDLRLDLDTQGGALLGSTAQRQAALSNYLAQFDAAQERGKGDAQMMTLFKDAFSQLNRVDDTSPRPAGHGTLINTFSRSMLTGLADFNASLTQTTSRPNAQKPEEEDRFAYQVSQSTSSQGQGNSIAREQRQQATLDAAWHSRLDSSARLTGGVDTDNYRYHVLREQASSTTRLAIVEGDLTEAKVSQEASSTKRVLTVRDGVLQSDVSTPRSASKSRDLMDLLDQLLKQEEKARRDGRESTLEQQLAGHRQQWLLQTDPALI